MGELVISSFLLMSFKICGFLLGRPVSPTQVHSLLDRYHWKYPTSNLTSMFLLTENIGEQLHQNQIRGLIISCKWVFDVKFWCIVDLGFKYVEKDTSKSNSMYGTFRDNFPQPSIRGSLLQQALLSDEKHLSFLWLLDPFPTELVVCRIKKVIFPSELFEFLSTLRFYCRKAKKEKKMTFMSKTSGWDASNKIK